MDDTFSLVVSQHSSKQQSKLRERFSKIPGVYEVRLYQLTYDMMIEIKFRDVSYGFIQDSVEDIIKRYR